MQLSPFLRCFPYHRSPFQGTHGDRVAGDNTRSRHNLRHFSYCATSPAWQLRNGTPRILVLSAKSDARFARRLAAPIPSFKLHIPFISTPAQALVSGVGVPPNLNHQADNLAKLRHEFLPVIELIEKIFGAVSRTKA